MTLNEYQTLAARTADYPVIGHRIVYPVLGLIGEAGELANKVKKVFRDDGGVVTEERRVSLLREVGDVLWYVSEVCRQLDASLDEVAQMNIDGLSSRAGRKTIHGDGDER